MRFFRGCFVGVCARLPGCGLRRAPPACDRRRGCCRAAACQPGPCIPVSHPRPAPPPSFLPRACRFHKATAGGVLEVPAEGGARVREAARPLVEWLEQDTETESDSEEE